MPTGPALTPGLFPRSIKAGTGHVVVGPMQDSSMWLPDRHSDTAQQSAGFHRLFDILSDQGYLLLRGLLSPTKVAAARARITDHLDQSGFLKPGAPKDEAAIDMDRYRSDMLRPGLLERQELAHQEPLLDLFEDPRLYWLFQGLYLAWDSVARSEREGPEQIYPDPKRRRLDLVSEQEPFEDNRAAQRDASPGSDNVNDSDSDDDADEECDDDDDDNGGGERDDDDDADGDGEDNGSCRAPCGPSADISTEPRWGIKTLPFKWLRAVGPDLFTGPHLDRVYLSSRSPRLLTAWIPLGAIAIEMGSLMVVPGSNSSPQFHPLRTNYGASSVGKDGTASGWIASDPNEIEGKTGLPQDTVQWLGADYQPGDVCIIGLDVLHMTSTNTTDRWRISCDTRWFPAGDPSPF
ncbi:uncharacterized protein BJ171DRAFT_600481 [Polychytrium aggregatum]|uniref:uncharacterized protein n=1 Tax=Polychytrium aggregatum TaxID=110093 RepID=UPI0022FE1BF8|nr:uncharacterized protein BJ171DRAFT_600481 [Polychytrium aggregatum]KAI9203041.1 hypothetical protein BJ171DRAFT_600481 [Polychytrium aggregatum]